MNTRPFILDLQMFAEDPQKQEEPVVDPDKNYVKAIADLKANTVSKADYEKLEEQNRQLLDAVINGGSVVDAPEQEEGPSIQELRDTLFKIDNGLNNLDYWKNALLLRKKLMEQGETDPFVPVGKRIAPEQSDYEAAQRVAEVVEECIAIADGDSAVFTNELQRRTIDTLPRR